MPANLGKTAPQRRFMPKLPIRHPQADDLTRIADLEVDVWVILRRFIPNALELAAANAHDRHPDFIMKFRITFHLKRAAREHGWHPEQLARQKEHMVHELATMQEALALGDGC
jgi:LmbE family N-acetylglucosaminyl deacetylase